MFNKDNSRTTYTVQPPLAWLKKAVLVASIAGFAGLIWYVAAQRDSLSTEMVEPEMIRAPKVAIKERPDAPGGMEVPHQDKQVFNLLDGGAQAEPIAEPAPEAEQQAVAVAPKAEVAVTPTQAPAPVVAPAPIKVEKKPEPAPVTPAPVKVEPKPATTVATTASGWAVQLGSFRSDADAQNGIKIIQKKYGTMLDGLKPYVQRADLSKGTFYRVMFVGLENKTAASNLCAAFKQRGQGCLHVNL